ncbi:MAG: hypothetical protein IJ709_06720 [Selenomonas sp.]|nr:hypothetical protein [Selenomonas sp.]
MYLSCLQRNKHGAVALREQPHVYVYEEDIMMNKHAYLDYAAITVADIDWSLTRAA